MIEGLSFGAITIDGKIFTSDLIIFPDGRVKDSWWRSRGHRLQKEDIKALVATGPDIIIAGTGINGLMHPEPGLKDFLLEKGIAFFAAKNEVAMLLYNDRVEKQKVGACFHLTC
jgi:hypothetical protein